MDTEKWITTEHFALNICLAASFWKPLIQVSAKVLCHIQTGVWLPNSPSLKAQVSYTMATCAKQSNLSSLWFPWDLTLTSP